MSVMFEELDYRVTTLGALSLRRRRNLAGGEDIYEIILGDAFLMSSRFTAAEIALARIGLERCSCPTLDVVVGGLGLGYTARAVLEDGRVNSLLVIDRMPVVIEWHETGLLPLGKGLISDHRCRLGLGDFFAMAASDHGFDPDAAGRRFSAVLVDIDHSPKNLLDPANGEFYSIRGMERLKRHLSPGGVYALWSNDPPDPAFVAVLNAVFSETRVDVIDFAGPSGAPGPSNSVYSAIAN